MPRSASSVPQARAGPHPAVRHAGGPRGRLHGADFGRACCCRSSVSRRCPLRKRRRRRLRRGHASPSSSTKAFFLRNYARMIVHSPYFDSRLRWYPRGWAYLDLYGISTRSRIARQHPSWILRDSAGNKLFIPFACSGGSCVQYAGDPTNPAFRRWWIRRARRIVRRGYKGLYLDNVNLIRRVSYGTGQEVAPQQPAQPPPHQRRRLAPCDRQVHPSDPPLPAPHRDRAQRDLVRTRRQGQVGPDADPLRQLHHARARRERPRADRRRRTVRPSQLPALQRLGPPPQGRCPVLRERRHPVAAQLRPGRATSWSAPGATSSRPRPPATPPTGGGDTRSASERPRASATAGAAFLRRDFQRGMVLMNEPGSPTRSISPAAHAGDGRSPDTG